MSESTYAPKTVGKIVYMFIISEKMAFSNEYYPHVNKKTPGCQSYPQLRVLFPHISIARNAIR